MKKYAVLRCLSVLSFLVIWWLGSLVSPPQILPGPMAIARTILSNFVTPDPEGETAAFHIAVTLARIIVGFTLAMLAGPRLV